LEEVVELSGGKELCAISVFTRRKYERGESARGEKAREGRKRERGQSKASDHAREPESGKCTKGATLGGE
jgi:hypothetical protein